jgi:hypothetical protein
MPTDDRQAFRFMVDVLATPQQITALGEVIGEALCAAPGLHAGPCRVAWSMHVGAESDADEDGAVLTSDDVRFIHEHLASVEVWPPEAVDHSLGIATGANQGSRRTGD